MVCALYLIALAASLLGFGPDTAGVHQAIAPLLLLGLLAAGGAGIGALADRDKPGRGALIGAGVGATGGLAAGVVGPGLLGGLGGGSLGGLFGGGLSGAPGAGGGAAAGAGAGGGGGGFGGFLSQLGLGSIGQIFGGGGAQQPTAGGGAANQDAIDIILAGVRSGRIPDDVAGREIENAGGDPALYGLPGSDSSGSSGGPSILAQLDQFLTGTGDSLQESAAADEERDFRDRQLQAQSRFAPSVPGAGRGVGGGLIDSLLRGSGSSAPIGPISF